MSWDRVTVGELVSTKKGFAFKSDLYVESGVPIVRVSNFTLDSISDEDLKYYPERERVNYSDFVLREKDIIVQTVGSWQYNPASVVGKVVHVPYYLDGALLNQNAVKLIPNERVDRDFLYYRLRCDDFKGHVIGEARGAANQASITLDTIKSFSFDIPDYELQCKISAIIAAYDNLIENNQRQIKLLEEAARRLYKEWFVDLRFPGYENTPIVDGVPEGWADGTLGDIAVFKRGKTITKAQVSDGNIPVVAGGLEPAYYHNKANTTAPLITVSASGANAGFTRLYNIDVFASDCSYIDSNSTPFLLFVYCFLKTNAMKLNSLQKGSAQPHVYAKDLNALVLSVPSEGVLTAFCGIVSPYFERIRLLQRENEIAAQARDRLLPKLMSGEIEV